LASYSDSEVAKFLRRRLDKVAFEARRHPAARGIILSIPLSAIAPRVEKGKTSKRQLARLRNDVRAKFGVDVFIDFQPGALEDHERALSSVVSRKAGMQRAEIVLTPGADGGVEAWVLSVGRARGDAPTEPQEIRKIVREYLFASGFDAPAVHFVASRSRAKGQPLKPAILRALKAVAPATVRELAAFLSQSNFQLPSQGWLQGQLDQLRKKGLVLRRANDERFVLTSRGLAAVPAMRTRGGSDVVRALALARRRW
jgi:hypothetical protein